MIINLISGPRNVSTALMYSFAQRTDTKVVDEPFYAYYLAQTDVNHPGREEVLQTMPTRKEDVLAQIFAMQQQSVLLLKNMAHHLVMDDLSFLLDMKNILLIRDLKQLIISFAKVVPDPTVNDIGIRKEYELFNYLHEQTGERPHILNTNELLKAPEKVLTSLCDAIDIPFDPSMLSWKAGARAEDGIWAKYWYGNVHQSTGFSPQSGKDPELDEKHLALYEEAMPYFKALNQYAIKA